MEALAVIVVGLLLITPILALYLFFKVHSLSGKVRQLEESELELKNRIGKLEFNWQQKLTNDKHKEATAQKQPELPERNIAKLPDLASLEKPEIDLTTVQPPLPDKEMPLTDSHVVVLQIKEHEKETASAYNAGTAAVNATAANEKGSLWERLGGENWIGVLGSVLLLIGSVFLITFAALQVEPVYRFVIVVLFSALVGGTGFALRKQEKWENLGSWLRSTGGALLLFGCLGSGNIPGLQWITQSTAALVLLTAGIGVNLALGLLGGKQVFASLHVVLSLVALSLAPQTNLTLGLGAVITLFGLAPAFKERWDWHLLLTVLAFFVFHLAWRFYFDLKNLPLSQSQHLFAIAACLPVGITAAIVHYRQVYTAQKFEVLPFIGHLANWLFLSVSLAMHALGSTWKTLYIALGAVAVIGLAQRAKKLGIIWLYYTDMLLAQIALLVALLTLTDWQWATDNDMTVLCLMYLEALLFTAMMLVVKEVWLYRAGMLFAGLLGVLLLAMGLQEVFGGQYYGNYLHAGMLLVAMVATAAFEVFSSQNPAWGNEETNGAVGLWHRLGGILGTGFSLTGLLCGLFPVVIWGYAYNELWAVYAVAGIFLGLLYLRKTTQSNGLGTGLLAAILLWHYAVWQNVYDHPQWQEGFSFVYVLPLLPVSALAAVWSYVATGKHYFRAPGLYLSVLGAAFTAWYFLDPVWVFAPALVFLAMSLLMLEIAKLVNRNVTAQETDSDEPDRFLLQLGYILLFAFVMRHFTIHGYAEQSLGVVKVRWLVALAGFGAMVYWALQQPNTSGRVYPLWSFVQPLMPELLLGFTIGVAVTEVAFIWQPVAWVVLALGSLALTFKKGELLNRFRFYALLLSWASAVGIIYVSHERITPLASWFAPVWLAGVAGILLLFVFIAFYYPYRQLQGIQFPPVLQLLAQIPLSIIRHKTMWWIFYPVFISLAVFLYYSFSKSGLTLLWVMECFAIFSLALLIRENHFRYVAFAGVLICLVRLVVFDLAQTGTLARALAFLGMGGLLLAMYVVGNRFKDRWG